MERSSGFRMVFLDEEWGGGFVVVAVVVVKDFEMRIVGNRKNCRVGVVVVVLSSILKGFSFLEVTTNDERRTTSACLSLDDYSSQEADFE